MAVNKTNEMTREGYDNLNAELEHLITVKRKENAERLKEAIALGDISENAEYDAAKDEEAQVKKLYPKLGVGAGIMAGLAVL